MQEHTGLGIFAQLRVLLLRSIAVARIDFGRLELCIVLV